MSYPEKFEGIAIQSHEDWKTQRRQSMTQNHFMIMTLTLRSRHVVSAVVIFIVQLVIGAI